MKGSPLGSLAPLGGCRFEWIENLILLRSVGSTNEVGRDLAARMLAEGNEIYPTVIYASSQEEGRGRSGRRWESPEGSLAVSLLLPWPESPRRVRLPLEIGIPLAQRLSEIFGVDVRLKWPNDLMVAGKKLGGILIETKQGEDGEGMAVVGIGLNSTTTREGLDRLALAGATSLLAAGAKAEEMVGDRPVLGLLDAIDSAVGTGEQRLETAFSSVSAQQVGEKIVVHDGPRRIEGSFLGVTADGFLRLRTSSGEEIVLSGEVESF